MNSFAISPAALTWVATRDKCTGCRLAPKQQWGAQGKRKAGPPRPCRWSDLDQWLFLGSSTNDTNYENLSLPSQIFRLKLSSLCTYVKPEVKLIRNKGELSSEFRRFHVSS